MNAVELTHSGTAVTAHTYTPAGSVSSHSHGLSSGYVRADFSHSTAQIHLKYKSLGTSWSSNWGANMSSLSAIDPTKSISDGIELGGTTDNAQPTFTGTKATLSHTVTQPSKHSFTPTTKSITQPTFTGTQATIATMPPYLTVYMWKRTA